MQGFHKKKSYTQILRFEKELCSFFIVPCCISTCVTRQNSNFECLKAFDVISTMIQCTYRHIRNVIEFILSSEYYLSNEKFGL